MRNLAPLRILPSMDSREFDAVVAAPKHHRLAMENEVVRVLETRVEPGETVPMHTHVWPAATYVLSFSHFVRRDESGEVTLDTRNFDSAPQPGEAMWTPALGLHTLENVGTEVLHVVTVEVKNS